MATAKFLMDIFDANPEKQAIIFNSQAITYSRLNDEVKGRIIWLSEIGVVKGDVVLLLGDYSLNSVSVLIALTEIGCILVPLTPAVYASLSPESLKEVAPVWKIDTTDEVVCIERYCQGAVTRPDLYALLDSSSSPGLVLFTSGSSGKPKAVVHNFSKLLEKFKVPRPSMITLNFLLFDHWGGLNTLFHCLSNAGLVVFPHERTPHAVCTLIDKFSIELLPATPSFLNMMLIGKTYTQFDLSSLKLITYGAEPMPETTLKHLVAAFPQVELRQTYGMIELGVLRAKSRAAGSLWVKVGGEGYDLRVVDGILQIKSQSAMLGYINSTSPFTEDGFLITGDMVDQDGDWIRILGRQSDLINVGGQKVYPSEVEAVILEHENVQEIIVYGADHALSGKIVCADISLCDAAEKNDARRSITKFARSRLQEYMVPMKIRFVDGDLQSLRLKKARYGQNSGAQD